MGPGKVVLTLQTNAGTSVRVTNSLKIGLTVSGTNNTGVNWPINGIAGGNAQIGTIVAQRRRQRDLHGACCCSDAEQRCSVDGGQRG